MDEKPLPKFDYYLDESDPDLVVLRRQDHSFVAAFSAEGFTKEGIIEAAKEDYRELLRSIGLGEARPQRNTVALNTLTQGVFTQPPRRISRKMSSRRSGLERGSVTQHRPEDVDPPTRQGDESLSVPLALCPLAIVEGPGLRSTA
jgi:hypothetical protein